MNTLKEYTEQERNKFLANYVNRENKLRLALTEVFRKTMLKTFSEWMTYTAP